MLEAAQPAHTERCRQLTQEWFAFLWREKRESENLYATSTRVLTVHAIEAAGWHQARAATLVGATTRIMQHRLNELGLNRKARHGRGKGTA